MNWMLGLIVYSPYMSAMPILYAIYLYSRRGMWSFRHPWTNGLFLLFLWSILVGVVNDQGIYISTSLFILGYFFVSQYLQDHYQSQESIEKLLSSLFFISLGSAFVTFIDRFGFITYDPAWWKFFFGTRSIVDIGSYQVDRVSGTFNNPNLAGTWYAVMIMIGFYFFNSKKRLVRIPFALGTLIFFHSLLLTESRAAIIGLFLGFVIYTYFSGHKTQMMILMFILLSGVALMLHRPEWFPRGEILFSSIRDREAIWINTFEMFLKRPVTGWGIMGIYLADRSVYDYLRVFHAHNILLTLATTLGIVGLLTFLYMQWCLLQEIRILYQANCGIIPLLSGIQAMILSHGLFDFTIMSPQICLLFISSAAFIGVLAREHSPTYEKITNWSQRYYKKV